ncbi:hypothetical protein HDU76_002023 [Blyttiomyces sp. JEL0837]|nr:hypothetical protein HDU76_002023 [Blyttiomyces sp. JEL0837]
MISNSNTNGASAPSKPNALDLSRFFSWDGHMRRPSSLKSLYPILIRPGMRGLAGGLPHPSFFGYSTLDASYPIPSSDLEAPKKEGHIHVPFERSAGKFLQYCVGRGWPQAVDACKKYIIGDRVPKYNDWDLFITAGNTMAMDSALRLLCERGDGLDFFEYTYSSAMESMRPLGLIPVPVKIDSEGLIPADLERAIKEFKAKHPGKNCRVVYTVPTGQNPTGTVMGVPRRLELLETAKRLDLLILEDDPYSLLQLPEYEHNRERRSEYNFPGTRDLLPSLFNLDDEASAQMIKQLVFYSENNTQSAAGPSQAMLAELLNEWGSEGLEQHALKLQKLYSARRDCLIEAAKENLYPASNDDLPPVEYTVPIAGMFVWFKVNLPPTATHQTLKDIFETLIDRKVLFTPGSYFNPSAKENQEPAPLPPGQEPEVDEDAQVPYFRVAFSYVSDEEMRDAMVIFGEVLREFGCGKR